LISISILMFLDETSDSTISGPAISLLFYEAVIIDMILSFLRKPLSSIILLIASYSF